MVLLLFLVAVALAVFAIAICESDGNKRALRRYFQDPHKISKAPTKEEWHQMIEDATKK